MLKLAETDELQEENPEAAEAIGQELETERGQFEDTTR